MFKNSAAFQRVMSRVGKKVIDINKINLKEDELQELINYLGRLILNWRICD